MLSLELGTADVCMYHNCNRNKTTSNVKNTKLNKRVRRKTQRALGAWGGACPRLGWVSRCTCFWRRA